MAERIWSTKQYWLFPALVLFLLMGAMMLAGSEAEFEPFTYPGLG